MDIAQIGEFVGMLVVMVGLWVDTTDVVIPSEHMAIIEDMVTGGVLRELSSLFIIQSQGTSTILHGRR
jgi:hypothetical protein